jgi:hypothetical protein
MGAWDIGPFDSDDSVDWLFEFFRTPGLLAVDRAFDGVESGGPAGIDAPTASNAWVAAEVLAALSGQPAASLPGPIRHWSRWNRWRKMATVRRRERAIRVLGKILAGSELADLWKESPYGDRWEASVRELQHRLRASLPAGSSAA